MTRPLRMLLGMVLLLGVQVMAWPVWAASFDCAKASTRVEKLICRHADLSKLDDQLHDVYHQLLKQASDKHKIRDSQRHWLKSMRNPCRSEQCVASAYQKRIRILQQYFAGTSVVSKVRGKFVLAYDLPKVKHKYMPVLPLGGAADFVRHLPTTLTNFASSSLIPVVRACHPSIRASIDRAGRRFPWI